MCVESVNILTPKNQRSWAR